MSLRLAMTGCLSFLSLLPPVAENAKHFFYIDIAQNQTTMNARIQVINVLQNMNGRYLSSGAIHAA